MCSGIIPAAVSLRESPRNRVPWGFALVSRDPSFRSVPAPLLKGDHHGRAGGCPRQWNLLKALHCLAVALFLCPIQAIQESPQGPARPHEQMCDVAILRAPFGQESGAPALVRCVPRSAPDLLLHRQQKRFFPAEEPLGVRWRRRCGCSSESSASIGREGIEPSRTLVQRILSHHDSLKGLPQYVVRPAAQGSLSVLVVCGVTCHLGLAPISGQRTALCLNLWESSCACGIWTYQLDTRGPRLLYVVCLLSVLLLDSFESPGVGQASFV